MVDVGVKIMLFVVVAFGGKAPRQDWSGWIQIKTVSFINFLFIKISQEYYVNLLEGTVHSRNNLTMKLLLIHRTC